MIYESRRLTRLIGSSFHYESLNKSDAVLVFVDPEVGLYQYAYNKNRQFEQSFRAQAEIAPLFDLPVVLAGSEKNGVNNDLAPIIESVCQNDTRNPKRATNTADSYSQVLCTLVSDTPPPNIYTESGS